MRTQRTREQSVVGDRSESSVQQPLPPRRADSTAPASHQAPRRRSTLLSSTRKRLPLSKACSARSTSSQPSAPSKGQSRRSRSPVFWGATCEEPLYAGPLGEVAGVVPAGAVLLEASRHRDVFGGWWISTRCDDGTLGWIAYSDSAEAPADGEALAAPSWHRVYDARDTLAAASDSDDTLTLRSGLPSTEINWCTVLPSISCAEVSHTAAAHFLFADAELYTYYWAAVHPQETTKRDWNLEYQRAVEQWWLTEECAYLDGPLSSGIPPSALPEASPHAQVEALLAAFRSEVERTVVQIWKEATMPPSSRQVATHPRFPDQVYFHGGILLRRCVDTPDGILGGDEMAMKCGRAIYRHQEILAHVAPRYALHVPLHAYCTFGGFSFLCSTVPPYGTASLIAADSSTVIAAEGSVAVSPYTSAAPSPRPALVSDLLHRLGRALRFEGGDVPREWRVYAGRDRRLYLSQTHRLLPPVLPPHRADLSVSVSVLPSTSSDRLVGTSGAGSLYASLLCCCVRPEVFFTWQRSWLPNECACSPQASVRRALDARTCKLEVLASQSYAAGAWIKSEGITRVAGTLGFQFSVSAPMLSVESCTMCDGDIDANELRFVVCTNALQCCCACMHCYTRLVFEHPTGDGALADPLAQACPTAVRCGAGCRKAGSFVMVPSLSDLMHANGLNLRYLAYVLHRLPRSTRTAVEHWCQVELVARAAKHLLQQDLRTATTPAEARSVCTAFFTSLLQPAGAISERFWRTRLGPALQSRFVGACEPFRLSLNSLRLVAERVAFLAGVTLSDSCLSSLAVLSATANSAASSHGTDCETGARHRESESVMAASSEAETDAFIEIEHIGPRTRLFPAPRLAPSPLSTAVTKDAGAEENSERSASVRGLAERLLLFWVGYTPEGANDAQQPFYLNESLLYTAL
ncbi:hypothetical protein LSCM1_01802 [Leishmania martiniquensis]|uniref:Clu domain-containing protein n=1 Tax=Leishmania martiniquensis TaxID=1580590 RepID=A0A836KLX9_9TRYP|nr:hypothetical protein LSCM1_01802 [Leishmania martiniquensis]